MSDFILSIDEGTTGIQASFFSMTDFSMHGNNKIEFPQIYPRPGLVEHNPEDIWNTTLKAIENSIKFAEGENKFFSKKNISAIGITNQRETCLAWNKKTGEIAGNAIVWQDRRTSEFCDLLKKNDSVRKMILHKTGLVCDPYFSASKMHWMLEHYAKAKQWSLTGELALGTIDSFLVWRLTGGASFVTDHTNASRTMLYNLHTGNYDSELLNLFSIPENALPEIKPSIGRFGFTKNVSGLPDGIPITGILGDQQAALFGQNCVRSGEAKITFGTGAFLLMNTGESIVTSDEGLLTTVAYSTTQKRTFALEGSAFIAGAAVQFLRDNFGWVKNSSESAELAMGYPRDEDVLFIPSLAGLGAPYWNPQARGVLFGMTRGTQKSQIIRAVLESIALQNVQLLRLMEKVSHQKIIRVGVDGGASRNDFLMQFQSNILQTTLVRPTNIETTSLGAAMAACVGVLEEDVEFNKVEVAKEFKPEMPGALANASLYKWLKAVDCVNAFYKK
ncbi:FGGY family carbohydrate kinase [Fluviispira multicolorata]|uniref:ATP:glycerol 3-phosphotransferase n=1 Tax=Fluviispira multicolorata TaxID=2654512 RepID=A0A833N6G2_9BACT|nr:glycerol kinase GlpK [Fluviispira multicolorata]KAB8033415.1 glycerol kinase GlpK [Fluviispira multicolorata]